MDIIVSHIFNLISVCFYFRKILNAQKTDADLLPLDIEIERTLRNLRKVTSAKSTSVENQRERLQRIPEEVETERLQRQMEMEDFWRPIIQDEYSNVRQLLRPNAIYKL